MNTTTSTYEAAPRDQQSFVTMISNLVRLVLRRWWLFLIVGVLAGLAGIYYATSKAASYASKLTFALDDGGGGSGVGGLASLASQMGLSVSSGKEIFSGDNILAIMKSRRMIERVLLSTDTFENEQYSLMGYYLHLMEAGAKNNKKSVHVSFPPGLQKEQLSYLQDSVLKNVFRDFSTQFISAGKPDKKLNIYEVNVVSPNEKFTKVFTDRLVDETNKFYTEIRTKKAKETLEILEDRVASMKGNLNSSLSQRATAQDANVNPVFAQAQVPVLKQQANIQAYGGAYNEMFKNLELARFQYLNEIPLMQIIDPADYPMERRKMGRLFTGLGFAIVACVILFIVLWAKSLVSPNPQFKKNNHADNES